MPGDGEGWTWTDRTLAAGVALASLVPRAALRDRGIFDIDSALLVLGVRSFDFASYHPHPPYHPLSIAAAKLLAPMLGAPGALVATSLLATAVLAVAVFAIGRTLGGRIVGAYAGLLVGVSALATENSGVALTYINEVAATAVVAWLALRARRRRDAGAWIALGLAAGVAVGLRPSAAVTAGPLMLWAIGRDWRALAQATAAGAAATLAWLLPMLAAGGGWGAFRHGIDYQGRAFVLHDPVWQGGAIAFENNLAWMAHHLRAELPWLATVGLLSGVAALPLARHGRLHRGFLLAWGLPALLFNAIVYAGWPLFHSGYVLALLPPAFVAGALALRRLHAVVQDVDRPLRLASTVVIAAVVASPLAWPASWGDALAPRREAQEWSASWTGLEEALPPNGTALLGGYAGHWAVAEHPGYLIWIVEAVTGDDGQVRLQVQEVRDGRADKAFFDNQRDGPADAPHAVPDWVDEVALVEGHPDDDAASSLSHLPVKREVVLPGGARVRVIDAQALATIEDAVAGHGQAWSPPPRTIWPPGR